MKDLLSIRRLRCLGHTARMDDVRIPKRLLFGWLPRSRPAHGAKLRWRDKVRKDSVLMRLDGTALPKIGLYGEICANKD